MYEYFGADVHNTFFQIELSVILELGLLANDLENNLVPGHTSYQSSHIFIGGNVSVFGIN